MFKSLSNLRYLYVRGIKQAIRPLPSLLPEFIMPVGFFVLNSSAFQELVNLPGFDSESYLQFYAPVALLTAIFISSGSTGLEMVTDISTGFMDRLFLTPVKRWHIVMAKLAGVGTKSAIMVGIMMILFAAFGARYDGGIVGILFTLLFAFIFAMAWAGIGLSIAFITKNPRAVQSSFIFFFPFSMITTSQLPLHLLHGWYKQVVMINPVTYILEGIRTVLITGQVNNTVWLGLAAAVGFAAVTLGIATRAFSKSIAAK